MSFRDGEFWPKYFENYPIYSVIDKRKGLRAPLTKPIVPYAVDSSWRNCRWIIQRCRSSIGSKSEKLATARPMKGCRTRGVRTLRVTALIERTSFDGFAAWGPMLVAICSNSQPLFLQALNSGPQPTSDHFFDLTLIAVSIEGIQRLT